MGNRYIVAPVLQIVPDGHLLKAYAHCITSPASAGSPATLHWTCEYCHERLSAEPIASRIPSDSAASVEVAVKALKITRRKFNADAVNSQKLIRSRPKVDPEEGWGIWKGKFRCGHFVTIPCTAYSAAKIARTTIREHID